MGTGLQTVNQQRKLSEWAERVSACRSSGLSVKTWCRENGVSEQTYYKWQRRLYELAQEEREGGFAEITPIRRTPGSIAVTVQIGGVEKVYICCGYTDLRQGIDGLSALVKLEFDLDPFSNTLFL